MVSKSGKFGFLVLAAYCIGLVWITGCASTAKQAPEPPAPVPDVNVLRVGISPNAPPLIFKQGSKIVGLEADFAREFAKYLGKSLRFVELEWEDQIPSLLANRIDIIMSGMTITRLREVRVAFSNPYFRSGQMALIRREDAALFKTGFFTITKSAAIGSIKNTTGEYFVENQFGRVKKISFNNSKEAVKALLDKKINMFVHDAPIILWLGSENENNGLTPLFSLLTEEDLAWGIRKDDKKLLASANNFLKMANEEGRLKQIIRHWIPFTD